jgi:hypothetical protein
MSSWMLTMVIAPRWFLAAVVFGSSLFGMAMGFIGGLNTPLRRQQ